MVKFVHKYANTFPSLNALIMADITCQSNYKDDYASKDTVQGNLRRRVDSKRGVPPISIQLRSLNLKLLTLSWLENSAIVAGLLGFAEGPAACAHVKPVSVDQTVLAERGSVEL
jgi:hypothetical protein